MHTDRFLRQDTVYYDETAIAGKTGWTSTAGNCLMTVMQRDGRTLIAVVLQSDSDEVARAAYVDSQTLFDYGFDQFVQTEWTLPAQSEQYSDQSGSTVTLQSGEVSFQCLLPAGGHRAAALTCSFRRSRARTARRKFGCGWRTVPFGRGCWERFR